jgi:hypothetical protein
VTGVLALLLLSVAAVPPQVLAVRLSAQGERSVLSVLTSSVPTSVETRREGEEVVLVVGGLARPGLEMPAPLPPVEAIRSLPEEGRLVLRLRVAPEVPFELRRADTLVSLVFGESGLRELASPSPIEAAELYPQLFPPAGAERPEEKNGEVEPRGEGFWLGSFRFRPAIVLSYIDADVALSDSGQPVRQHYFEVQPTLGGNLGLSVWGGRIRASYEPRFRTFANDRQLKSTTHLAQVGIDLTVGQRLELHAAHHFSTGLLETSEVDPGREYFLFLGRYKRNDTTVGARIEMTPRLGIELSADVNRIDVDQPASFFGHGQDTFRAGFGYELTEGTKAVAGYERVQIPFTSDRPVIEGNANAVFFRVQAIRDPALSGEAEIAYREQDNPQAPVAGRRFRGITFGTTLRRTLGARTVLEVGARRAVDTSSFEQNAFYVSSSAQAAVTVPLPWDLSVRGSVNVLWNRYQVESAGFAEPREDDIFGWTIGGGRAFGKRVFVRADYRRERRNSNLPGFDVVNHSFIAQLGVGLFVERNTR